MSQFDESKHNRAQDGKFTNKPHAEAGTISLSTATPTTTFSTWTRIFKTSTFEEATNGDPYNELDLTDDQRDALNETCRAAFIEQADSVLAPYGATMLGNGDIVGAHSHAGDFDDALLEGDLKEELGMIDLGDTVADWMDEHAI